MHPLNRYQERPDFAELAKKKDELTEFVTVSSSGYASIDFQDAAALRALTRALLKEDFLLEVELRDDRLCPTIANRLDYLLMILDLEEYIEPGSRAMLDIGTGAYAIYGLLMSTLRPECRLYATDIDSVSIAHARKVIRINKVKLKLHHLAPTDPILKPLFDGASVTWTVCNPPFFSSREEMHSGTELKETSAPAGATAAENELITPGGEVAFVSRIIHESVNIPNQCQWFTTLLGKLSSVGPLVNLLRSLKIDNYFIRTSQPSRTVRWILGWSFTDVRLPDSLTRAASSSLARYIPPSSEFSYKPHPPLTNAAKVIEDIMARANIPFAAGQAAPLAVTWTRQARRRSAALIVAQSSEPILRATVTTSSSSITLRWTHGRVRSAIESLWVYLLRQLRLQNV